MATYDYQHERSMFDHHEALHLEKKLRSFLIRSLREPLEDTEAANVGHRVGLERMLVEVDRRIALRMLAIADGRAGGRFYAA